MHRRPYQVLLSLSVMLFAWGAVAGEEPDGEWLS